MQAWSCRGKGSGGARQNQCRSKKLENRLQRSAGWRFIKLPKLKTRIHQQLDRLLGGGLYFGQVDIIAGKTRGWERAHWQGQMMANAMDQGYKCFVYSGELPDYLFKAWLDFQVAGAGKCG